MWNKCGANQITINYISETDHILGKQTSEISFFIYRTVAPFIEFDTFWCSLAHFLPLFSALMYLSSGNPSCKELRVFNTCMKRTLTRLLPLNVKQEPKGTIVPCL